MNSLAVLNALILSLILAFLTGARCSSRNDFNEDEDDNDDDSDDEDSDNWTKLAGHSRDDNERDLLNGGHESLTRLHFRAGTNSCGLPLGPQRLAKRSLNGYDATSNNQSFFMAMIRIQHLHGADFCSGGLISDRHVITAAHCVTECNGRHSVMRKDKVSLVLGLKYERYQYPLPVKVADVIVHPKFNHCNKDFVHDLAILKLAKRVEFTAEVNKICLPPADFSSGDPSYGNMIFHTIRFYGYGLRDQTGDPLNDWKILNTYRADNYNFEVCDAEMLCINPMKSQRARPCRGDSGGPLVAELSTGYILLGINSVTNANYTKYSDCQYYDDKVYQWPRFVNIIRLVSWIGKAMER